MISVQLLYLNLHFTSCLFVDMQNYVYLTQENVLNPITIHQLKVPLPLLCAMCICKKISISSGELATSCPQVGQTHLRSLSVPFSQQCELQIPR